MSDTIFTIAGYLGAANATLMMIPQVYLTIKKKSFEDLSIQMIFMNLFTQCLFFPYTIHFKLYPLITVNSVLSICDIIIIYYYYKKRDSIPLFLKDSLVQSDSP
jgi:uncharacterized protein with PQ loop repeat